MSSGPIAEVSVEELADRITAGGVTLFDVREPAEFEEARVPGAVLVSLGTVPDNVDAFAAAALSTEVLVICRSGGRSMRACEFLAEHGVIAKNVAGGTMAWLQSGRDSMSGAL